MPWKSDGAYALGLASPPEAGDVLLVILDNDDDPENVLTEEIRWTYDGQAVMPIGAFRTMVLAQIAQRLAVLNAMDTPIDVTDWLFGP